MSTSNTYTVGANTETPSGAFASNSTVAVGIDNIRRTFGISDKVAQLAPQESIFFSYLNKLGKKPTDETVWKPLEYRNQWQRRNFKVSWHKLTGPTTSDGANITDFANAGASDGTHFVIWTDYDNKGKQTKSSVNPDEASFVGYAPIFLTKNQIVRFNGVAYKLDAEPKYYKYTGAGDGTASTKAAAGTEYGYCTIDFANVIIVSSNTATANSFNNGAWDKEGQVIGSQWGEGTGAPEGFRDELSSAEFYTQIFKTSVPLMSGSTMATKYRGFSNEWKRIYTEHIKAHKMDLENAFLFGYGNWNSADLRTSWGVLPFLENHGGKRYSLAYAADDTTDAASGVYDYKGDFTYDGLVSVMDDFMSWEGGNSGQKLCLTSRKVINHLHKMGSGGFMDKSLDGNLKTVFSANLDVKTSSFMPVEITGVSTSWGSMNFVAHPLFRGDMENKAVCIDLRNISYRPLAGNGISRDTFVETNIQENDTDGRKDQIITEAGLEIMLPETHAAIDFV